MALTLRRLGWILLALGAVLVPALRTSRAPAPTESEQRSSRLAQLRIRLDEAGFRWGMMTERDSGAVPASHVARPGFPAIFYRGFPAGAKAPLAEAIVTDLWHKIGSADSTIAVAVVVYSGAPYEFPQHRWGHYVGARIASRDGGLSCVAMVPGIYSGDVIHTGKDATPDALAPCLLLATFGVPGAALAPWLTRSRYSMAQSTAWLNRSRSFIDGRAAPPWFTYFRYEGPDPGAASRSLLLSSETGRWIAGLISPPYELGQAGLRCLDGDLASCRATILDSIWIAGRTRALPEDLTYSGWLVRGLGAGTLTTPSPPGHWWLSDLIRDQGREKFARFWKSDHSFEQAFRDAFGEELGAWTRRWGLRQWENSWDEMYRHQPRLLGVTMEPSWPLLALGWTGVALLASAYVARRRQAV